MLIPLILRFCAAEALRGKTFAEERVYDSSVNALDEFLKDQSSPFIVVSTDEADIGPDVFDVCQVDKVDLVLDLGVGAKVTANNGDVSFVIPHTDAGTEMAVNILTRQVLRELFEPNSGGDFGKIFRKVASKPSKISVRRGAGAENGVRFSAAQLIISLAPLQEPAFGREPANVFLDFIQLLRDHPVHNRIADAIATAFAGEAIPDWKATASALGISDETADAIGIYSLGGQGDVLAAEATVTGEDEVLSIDEGTLVIGTIPIVMPSSVGDDAGSWVVNAAVITEQLPEEPT